LESSVSIGENLRHINKRRKKLVYVLVWRRFSPILTLLSKHLRKSEGVQKSVSENLSYLWLKLKIFFNFLSKLNKQFIEIIKKSPKMNDFQENLAQNTS
jgi:hypothetical protein